MALRRRKRCQRTAGDLLLPPSAALTVCYPSAVSAMLVHCCCTAGIPAVAAALTVRVRYIRAVGCIALQAAMVLAVTMP